MIGRDPYDYLPTHEAGCRMPSAGTIIAADNQRRFDAEEGSRKLLEAIQRYFSRGGRG